MRGPVAEDGKVLALACPRRDAAVPIALGTYLEGPGVMAIARMLWVGDEVRRTRRKRQRYTIGQQGRQGPVAVAVQTPPPPLHHSHSFPFPLSPSLSLSLYLSLSLIPSSPLPRTRHTVVCHSPLHSDTDNARFRPAWSRRPRLPRHRSRSRSARWTTPVPLSPTILHIVGPSATTTPRARRPLSVVDRSRRSSRMATTSVTGNGSGP
jgi:hypothetical protein